MEYNLFRRPRLILIFDRYYTTPTALWVSVVGVVVAHTFMRRMQRTQLDVNSHRVDGD